jgi:hypothetical protein
VLFFAVVVVVFSFFLSRGVVSFSTHVVFIPL